MEVKVEHFGPIESVNLELNPFTVIIGKNNLGKSYLAQLYYALLDSSKTFVHEFTSPRYYYTRGGIYPTKYFHRYRYSRYGAVPEETITLSRQIKKSMADSAILGIVFESLTDNYGTDLQRILRLSLERSFGVKIGKLVSLNSNSAQISWDLFEHLSLSAQITRRGALKITLLPLRSGKKIIKDFEKSHEDLIGKIRRARTRKSIYVQRLYLSLERELMIYRIDDSQRQSWSVTRAHPSRRASAYYIPAGRGGLLESYETVVGGLVSLSPVAPVRGLSMPPLPGMAAQFYTVLLRLRGEKGPLSRVVSGAFRHLLEGDVQLKRVKGQPKSRLVYRFSSGEKTASTDVIHAASMIKELSPIYLIVQELVKSGDFLLIEEPESHLHPGAQLRFVDIIATLVNNGVNILLTTHSDLFLRAIGHLVGKDQEDEIFLDESSVAIYWLKDEKFGCKSQPLKISKHGAIEDIPTFDEIVRALYEEEVELEKKARRKQ